MAKKNPFVNSKSKKRKSKKIIKPVKPYCPASMVRYEGSISGYQTIWLCTICLVYCLTDNAATQHSSKCRKSFELKKKVLCQSNSL